MVIDQDKAKDSLEYYIDGIWDYSISFENDMPT